MTQPQSKRSSPFFMGILLGFLAGGALALLILFPGSQKKSETLPESVPAMMDSAAYPKPEPRNGIPDISAETPPEAVDTLVLVDTSSADLPDSIEVLNYLEQLDAFWDTAYWEEDSLDDYRAWRQESDSLVRPARRIIPEDIRTAAESPEVLTDILLYRKQIPVMEEARDSLGQLILREAEDSPLIVSFWKSPLNYKGYRKGGSNLVLFGVYAIDSVRLLRSGPHLYLDVMDDRFLITETYDYKHLIEMSRKKTLPR